jgi:hypothetical protein
MRNVQRSAGPIGESLHAVDVMPGEPFVQLLTAHAEALGELGDRVQTGQINLDKSRSFFHRTGYLPCHHTPSLPEDECHPCSRSVLSPMCSVCTLTRADKPPVRWPGGRAASGGSNCSASRRLHLAPSDESLVAAAVVPYWVSHVRRPAAQCGVRRTSHHPIHDAARCPRLRVSQAGRGQAPPRGHRMRSPHGLVVATRNRRRAEMT